MSERNVKRLVAVAAAAAVLVVSIPTRAYAGNIDHGPFYKSDLSVACFVDKGEYPDDGSRARWACWRVANLKHVNTSGFRTVYRGKLGGLYGTAWGARDDLTFDGQPSKAKSSRLKYEPTYFCHGRSNKDRRTWSCFRDSNVTTDPVRWVKDELPDHCNDLTTWYIAGRADNPNGPVRSTCR